MTLTDLRYIIALARERHFRRAAEACFVSQPTLSVAVKKLEDELGVVLFERSHTDVSLTPVGEQVVDAAQRTLEAAESVKQVASAGQDQLTAPLKVGAIYTVGPYLFPELIPHLKEIAPQMPLIVEEGYTADLTEQLKQGELDVILISLPFEEPNILTLPLYEEPFVVLLPASHPLIARKTLSSKQLENESMLLLGAGHCFRDQVLEACPGCLPKSVQGEHAATRVEGSSLETIRHMVASGMGLTIVPCTSAGTDRYSQRLLEIRRFARPIPKRTIALAWRISFPRPQVIDVMHEAVAACQLSCVKHLS